jgi:hypothetical protein
MGPMVCDARNAIQNGADFSPRASLRQLFQRVAYPVVVIKIRPLGNPPFFRIRHRLYRLSTKWFLFLMPLPLISRKITAISAEGENNENEKVGLPF